MENFLLQKQAQTKFWCASYLGMKTQEVSAASSTVSVKLMDDSVQLRKCCWSIVRRWKNLRNSVTSASQIVNSKKLHNS
jgi:phage-related tail protein